MSVKGIYTALSGAMAQSSRLDTIANNIANVNTPAFKRDQQVFKEYLTANEKPPEVIQAPRIPASIESFYDMQGGDKSYVDAAGTYTDFSQGGLKPTGNSLDVAFDGAGFFEVATPSGVMLTRNGSFAIDGNGQLVNKQGYPILRAGADGADIAQRVIRIGAGSVGISDAGELIENGEVTAQLSIVDVADKDKLSKVGNSLFTFKQNAQPELIPIERPSLKQGFVENSNINIVQEMTDMISASRVFESTQKAISAYDAMAEKLVNVVGKTNG
jgi:flagellar basal-body rod protein FlgF